MCANRCEERIGRIILLVPVHSIQFLHFSVLQINTWLENLMNECSEDLYRTKGVLSIDGWDERFVFQVCFQARITFKFDQQLYILPSISMAVQI